MGKATIVSHDGDGFYTIDHIFDNETATARIQVINDRLNTIQNDYIPTKQAEITAKETEFNNALAALDTYIDTTDPKDYDFNQLSNLQTEAFTKRVELDQLKIQLAEFQAREELLTTEKDRLTTNSPNSKRISAWCADYTLDLTGDVGTIELVYELDSGQTVLVPIILPGDPNASTYQAAYNQTRDGIITNYYNMGAAQIYANRAWLPALGKWRPRFRTGVITSIDYGNDQCNLTVDSLKSSQQNIFENYYTALSNVPILYMDCNSAIFEINDHVVIAFPTFDWDGAPIVIGFVDHPKECSKDVYIAQAGSAITRNLYDLSGVYSGTTGQYYTNFGPYQHIIFNDEVYGVTPESWDDPNNIVIFKDNKFSSWGSIPVNGAGPPGMQLAIGANSSAVFVIEDYYASDTYIYEIQWTDAMQVVNTRILPKPSGLDFSFFSCLTANNSRQLLTAGWDNGGGGYVAVLYEYDIMTDSFVEVQQFGGLDSTSTEWVAANLSNKYIIVATSALTFDVYKASDQSFIISGDITAYVGDVSTPFGIRNFCIAGKPNDPNLYVVARLIQSGADTTYVLRYQLKEAVAGPPPVPAELNYLNQISTSTFSTAFQAIYSDRK